MKYVIVVLVLAAVAAAAAYFVRRRTQQPKSPEISAARVRLVQVQGELKVAQRARNIAIKGAAKELKDARAEREHAITSATKEIKALSETKGSMVGSYRGVTVYKNWITTPHGEGPIAGTNASVDAQVSSRITATRLLAIGVFALAAKKKTGAVYLSISSPCLASVVECPKDGNTKARQFAATIMNAARQAELQAAKLPALLEAAEQKKTAALANNSRLEAAQANKDRVEVDVSLLESVGRGELAVDAACRDLEALLMSATATDQDRKA